MVSITATALAAWRLEYVGVRVHPGERVRYVVTDAKSRDQSRRVRAGGVEPWLGYDVQEYVKLLQDAASEILMGASQ